MKITYQGVAGAYSQIAAADIFPGQSYISCESFEKAADLVKDGTADAAVLPIENSNAGKVVGTYALLPAIGLFIQGEYFLRIRHQLLGLPEANLSDITAAYSHPQALAQCSRFMRQHGISACPRADTAQSCKDILALNCKTNAAIASGLAAQIYGLKILQPDIENDCDNTTRFLVMGRENIIPRDDGKNYITSLMFRIKSVPSALYKALGGFADNNINLAKIESYMAGGQFISARFYVETESHPQRPAFQKALSQLQTAAEEINILGTYAAASFREKKHE